MTQTARYTYGPISQTVVRGRTLCAAQELLRLEYIRSSDFEKVLRIIDKGVFNE